jgi:hypothetical protein
LFQPVAVAELTTVQLHTVVKLAVLVVVNIELKVEAAAQERLDKAITAETHQTISMPAAEVALVALVLILSLAVAAVLELPQPLLDLP